MFVLIHALPLAILPTVLLTNGVSAAGSSKYMCFHQQSLDFSWSFSCPQYHLLLTALDHTTTNVITDLTSTHSNHPRQADSGNNVWFIIILTVWVCITHTCVTQQYLLIQLKTSQGEQCYGFLFPSSTQHRAQLAHVLIQDLVCDVAAVTRRTWTEPPHVYVSHRPEVRTKLSECNRLTLGFRRLLFQRLATQQLGP